MPFDLSESFIVAVEQELGASLPTSYRSSMSRENGGEIEVEEDGWQQYPIADTSDRKRLSRTANHVLKETKQCLSWPRFPTGALAIASNGTGDQLVFVRRGQAFDPEVYVWSHETGALAKVADDFTHLKAF
jgi:hypothetical protein